MAYSLSCRENVPGSRPKPNCWVHIHVLQGEAHRLAAGPHSLGQSLQSWERCGTRCDCCIDEPHCKREWVSPFITFPFLKKHCERQKSSLRVRFRPSLFQHVGLHSSLAGKIQKLTVSLTPSQLSICSNSGSFFLCRHVGFPSLCPVGQGLPEAAAPQDARQPPSWGFHLNEGIMPGFPKKYIISRSSVFLDLRITIKTTINIMQYPPTSKLVFNSCLLCHAGVSGSHTREDVLGRGLLLGHHSYYRRLCPLQIWQTC